ncbi:Aldehyde oxidoreductase FAD-binding subunit PaoB [Neolewinella maritima]|uniref:Aldehyde oxidoreductase FAD-binding subunit PaoB n=1 Tax=Neolewinella maritima TaxID=1383882 RepID=A0ABM9B0U6_9BACT|nr:xanthine dehydrogenase family protein subunit M [Neolewinella maritima]CAH1000624.1 Aldehyde oxidoreductase FAD-binding subunit PaoB [Neolewinella maritima]
MRPFTYVPAPTREDALAAATTNPQAKYLGGGTNLLDLMKEDVERPTHVIEVADLPYAEVTRDTDGGYTIGAMLSNSATANHPEIRKNYPLLSMTMLAAATAQIRNMATNGGNLLQRTRCPYFYETSMPCNKREPGSGCGALNGMNATHAIFGWSEHCVATHPSDMSAALAALDASVTVQQPGGGTRTLSITDFYRLPGDQPEKDTNLEAGELITAIHLPAPVFADHYYYLKIRERSSYAFALVSVAAGLQIENGTITRAGLAMGRVAHMPWKLSRAEAYLVGKEPTAAHFEQAAELEMREARTLSQNEYKVPMGQRAIVRALTQAYNREA